jgi:hypothetical protein
MTVIRVLSVVLAWLGLSAFSGILLAALGAGSLSLPWVLGSTAFMALFFSPVLAACCE